MAAERIESAWAMWDNVVIMRKTRRKQVGVTVAGFRRACLSMPEATEGSHMGHPDFRVKGRIFATLFGQERGLAMVKLKRPQQQEFVNSRPGAFAPIMGGWGRQGATEVRLADVDEATLRRAIITAWRNTAPKQLLDDLIFSEMRRGAGSRKGATTRDRNRTGGVER